MNAKNKASGKPIPPTPVQATNSSQEQNRAVERVRDPSSLFYDRLYQGGLDRIFQAVDETDQGKQSYSSNVNRDRLALELQSAHHQWMIRKNLDSKPITKEKVKLIQMIASDAKSLRGRLLGKGPLPHAPHTDYEYPTYASRALLGRIPLHDFKAFLTGLDQLIDCAKACADAKYLGLEAERNLTKTLVSEILSSIYERHFDRSRWVFTARRSLCQICCCRHKGDGEKGF